MYCFALLAAYDYGEIWPIGATRPNLPSRIAMDYYVRDYRVEIASCLDEETFELLKSPGNVRTCSIISRLLCVNP